MRNFKKLKNVGGVQNKEVWDKNGTIRDTKENRTGFDEQPPSLILRDLEERNEEILCKTEADTELQLHNFEKNGVINTLVKTYWLKLIS